MSNGISILQNYRSSLLRMEPYPHFSIDGALPVSIYEELSRSYPAAEAIFAHSFRKKDRTMAQNARYDLSSAEIYALPDLPIGAWRDFVYYHTSQEFLDEVLAKLGDVIYASYPRLFDVLRRKAPEGRPRAGVRRHSDTASECEIALDCQVGMNSPVTEENTSVIGPHIDNPKELYAGLFYLRHPEDHSDGGELVIGEWKDPSRARFREKRYIDDDLVTKRENIAYAANRFVWLLNGPSSVHGVTPRQRTERPRRLCNLIAEVYPTTPRLFDLPARRRGVMFRRRP